jgi:hypothetical protein
MKKDRKFTFHGVVDDESVPTQDENARKKWDEQVLYKKVTCGSQKNK